MTRVLLDTDLLSDVLRLRNPQVNERAQAYLREHGKFTISSVTVFEIVRGWHHAGRTDRADQFLGWAATFTEVIPFDTACAATAGRVGAELARAGTPIGVADVLIAATAVVHEVPIDSKPCRPLRASGRRLRRARRRESAR